jgi:hypothetical protein
MEVSETEEVKHVRDENARLKKLVADSSLEQGHAAVGDQENISGLVGRRAELRSLLNEFQSRERHACGLMKVPRTRYRYRSASR